MRACPPNLRIFAVCLSLNCGKDPILEAAENLEGATEAPSLVATNAEKQPMPADEEGEPEPGIPEEPEPAPPGTAEQPEPPPHSGDAGKPMEPKPGIPVEPKPAPPGSPGGANHPGKEGGVEQEGPQVLLRGVISGDVEGDGLIRIDLFDGDQRRTAGPRPRVVGVHEIKTMGSFEVSVAESTGKVWIGAYRDLNQNNRPNQGEPFGWYPNNPVYLDDPPEKIEIVLTVEGKSRGLGVDFRE